MHLQARVRTFALVALVACSPTREPVFGATRWMLSVPSLAAHLPQLATGPAGPLVVTSSTSGNLLETSIRIQQHAAADGALLWAQEIHATSPDVIDMPHLAGDDVGDTAVTGVYSGSVDFGGMVATTPGSTAFVAKYDARGTLLWVTDVGAQAGACGLGIATDSRERIYVAGNCYGTLGVGNTATPCHDGSFVAAFDRDGSPRWARVLGAHDIGEGSFVEIAVTTNDDIVVARSNGGETITWLSPDNELRWESNLTPNPSVALAADRSGRAIAADDSSMILLDSLGFEQWQVDQVARSVAVRRDGVIVAAGGGSLEAFSEGGDLLDMRAFDPREPIDNVSVAPTTDGSLALLGVEVDVGPLLTIFDSTR